MKKELSVYLDLLRITAAAMVFLGHLSWQVISGGFLWQLQPYGHSAVIVFFVLSGFVIRYVSDTKEKTLPDYAVARLSRLYSVVLPAIALTAICDAIGHHHNPAFYDMQNDSILLWNGIAAALFLSQSWQHLILFSNDAYWSLPHEFWYYVIFAAALFFKGWQRVAGILAAAAIAGPGILLLFPVWLAGALAYMLAKSSRLDRTPAWILWLMSWIGILAVAKVDVITTATAWYLPNAFSVLDFLLGALVAANIYAASFLSFGLARIGKPIAALAGMTFALYLFHLPLLLLASAYLPATLPSLVRVALEAGFALASVYLLSFLSEKQKHRWRGFFRSIVSRLLKKSCRPSPAV